ncbi:MAG: hypothetical protein L3J12_01460 [Spirochaetales bacterium]|nr:hypothetical protein [Spirochaetales bacterium]
MSIDLILTNFVLKNPELDLDKHFNTNADNRNEICRSLNAAFIIRICGENHRYYNNAGRYLSSFKEKGEYSGLVMFYTDGVEKIRREIINRCKKDSEFEKKLQNLNNYLKNTKNTASEVAIDQMWSVFFPEAEGVFKERKQRSENLRKKRIVNITNLNPSPLTNPGRQMIFTSNILLTIPDPKTDLSSLGYSESLIRDIQLASKEAQIYFYDHPIQIGTPPEANEIIYGLKGLDNTAAWEKEHRNMDEHQKLTVILSASVTHRGLQSVAKKYIKEELALHGNFKHLDIYIFTEEDSKKLINEVLLKNSEDKSKKELLQSVFGVDGEYGRHYSFLKAITALWSILVDTDKIATFKIDLDQVFPEKELKEQTGKSAFEHFKTALWGAEGTDSSGNKVELGMIAGALVNEKDIAKGIFTPDVEFDERKNLKLEERFFYSKLMMGLSTNTELATRYGQNGINGTTNCIQRIHVTGGTNGILIESLKKHRPFTPAFIGRAEDQAYLLSVMGKHSTGLAYLHEDGLIMRHDKEAFAAEAMKAASKGNMIGDFIRTLYFSRYTEILTNNISDIKKIIDPFTGCFVSKIPITAVLMRFCMKAADLFNDGKYQLASDFILSSYGRLNQSIEFAYGKKDLLNMQYIREREGWNLYYDILDNYSNLNKTDSVEKIAIQIKAAGICAGCRVGSTHSHREH